MTKPTILLVDNGSRRAEAALNLRRLAARLSELSQEIIHPVSLQHADKIPPESLEGRPASIFTPFLEQRLRLGERRFLVLPLLFGPSRALSSFIPDQVRQLAAQHGNFSLELAQTLCPLPAGEPRLAALLVDQLPELKAHQVKRVILVDHGSPLPEVTAVRHYLASEMRRALGPEIQVSEAVMERREGKHYDFNGPLLESVLHQAAEKSDRGAIALSLLFLSPGRHAGPGGDIESITQRIRALHPDCPIHISGLVGDHVGLLEILRDRLETVLGALAG